MQADREIQQTYTARGESLPGRFAYAACATPPGTSGIAVIRMAGTYAFDIADMVFKSHCLNPLIVRDMKGYSCAYGAFINPITNEVIDNVILTKFIAPNSYTGEDIIEISCHGGIAVKSSILDILFQTGATPAQPGEFSKNAFLNGKLDLAQAEAVMDLISATARKASAQATKQLNGALSVKIREISSNLYVLMSKVEMIVEFPEHEETKEAFLAISNQIASIVDQLDSLILSFKKGRILKEGLIVVIAGKPNAGKSSMLNTLAGYDRAIVTAIPGTTRDTVEEFVDIEGLPVRLIDTAGLRESSDEVEKMGIDRARKAIESADLVFWISSEPEFNSEGLLDQEEDLKEILSCHQENALALIIGKSDITPFERNRQVLQEAFPNAPIIPFSSVTKEGVDAVRELIRMKYEQTGAKSGDEVLITNARHLHAINQARQHLDMGLQGFSRNIPLDLLASVLRIAADDLALITGDEVNEELVNEIFSRFCIGK